MAFRFHKSLSIFPGLKLNLGKKGASLTVGKHGACLNFGKNGIRGTLGVPGTGMSWSRMLTNGKASQKSPGGRASPGPLFWTILALAFLGAMLLLRN